ncbi:beta-eliminating lyase-domain-containing protein [Ochromonadaceae sp. CCMP2298]|nr:beta-eliminating lyase-domain-containing protein [Ochromonadaceae sp. CCMP2298]
MIELWNSRLKKTPQELLLEISQAAEGMDWDVYGDYGTSADTSYLRAFEKEVGAFFGKEDALFLPSGVMAQLIALQIHCQDKARAFVCHHSSHLLLHEQDAYRHLVGVEAVVVPAKQSRIQEPLSLQAVTAAIDARQEGQGKGAIPAVVLLETPHREIGGKLTSEEELADIAAYCRRFGVALHCDGARLWEALACYQYEGLGVGGAEGGEGGEGLGCMGVGMGVGGQGEGTAGVMGRSLQSTASSIASHFDSLYVSFYKGLGGMTGAVLMGRGPFIAQARVWARRFGGNLFTLLPYAVNAQQCFRQYVLWNTPKESPSSTTLHPLSMRARVLRLQRVVALLTSISGEGGGGWGGVGDDSSDGGGGGGGYLRFDPPLPLVSLVHLYIRCSVAQATAANEQSSQQTGVGCFARVRPAVGGVEGGSGEGGAVGVYEECFFEFNLGPGNIGLTDAQWAEGWRAFISKLHQIVEN